MQAIELEETMKDVDARPEPRDPGVAADGIVRIEDALVRRDLRERMFGLDADPVSVGRYEVQRRLGAGGMGVVYAATDPDLGRDVALKLMATCSPAHADRLVREAKALASLDHPNVVTVHEIGSLDQDRYIAMELVQGSTLRQWLDEEHDTQDALYVVWQAAKGLLAAHEAGIVHRDFKPDNVMVDGRLRARVLDFGIAKGQVPTGTTIDTKALGESSLTVDGQVMGTPRYMSPEQLRGEQAGPASDVFALSVTICEAVGGAHPFERVDLATLTEPPTIPALPRPLKALVKRGLSFAPAERPSMKEMVSGLRDAVIPPRKNLLVVGILGFTCAGLGSLYAGRMGRGITLLTINAGLFTTGKVLKSMVGVMMPASSLLLSLSLCLIDVALSLRELRRQDRAANRILTREGMPLRRFPIAWALALLLPLIMFLGGLTAYFVLRG